MRRLGALSIVALASCSDATATNLDGAVHVECDLGAGLQIIGGNCVQPPPTCGVDQCFDSETATCGPCAIPAECRPPPPGTFCLIGTVRQLVDGSPLPRGEMVSVELDEPFPICDFCGPGPEVVTTHSFTFTGIPTPGSGVLGIFVGDPQGGPRKYFTTAMAVLIQSGQVLQVDMYAAPKSLVDSWFAAFPNLDCASGPCTLARFYDAPVPAPTMLREPAAKTVAGVRMTGDRFTAAHYFNTSLALPDAILTSTGPSGAAVVEGSGSTFTVSGMGGVSMGMPVQWDTQYSGEYRGILWIARLFECNTTPTAPSCQ